MARWRRWREPAEIPAWVLDAPADEMWQWLEDAYGNDGRRFFESLSAIMSTPVPAGAAEFCSVLCRDSDGRHRYAISTSLRCAFHEAPGAGGRFVRFAIRRPESAGETVGTHGGGLVGAVNGDDPLPGQQFGLNTSAWYSTNAPGSQGITASQDAPALAAVQVTEGPYSSGQLPRPSFTVSVGDTSAYSSDNPTPANALLPDNSGASATGAGRGRGHAPHPNAGA